jgi:hypothetical protein
VRPDFKMDFDSDDNLKLPVDKAVRICISAPIDTLNQIYSGRFPTGPSNYIALNLVGVELIQDVYSHMFRPVDQDTVTKSIRVADYIARDTFPEDGLELVDDNDIIWQTWSAIFDHLVPVSEINPETIQLYILEDAKVVRGTSKKDRFKINSQVQIRMKVETGTITKEEIETIAKEGQSN